MPTTTNYGWTTPADTDLVKDGASAIRTLGNGVDTTVKNLNPETTLGDISYRSSTANTNTRLAIGTTGQVLTVSGGVPVWATAAGGGKVLQVIQDVTTTQETTTSTTYVDTNLSQAITPSATSSKILVIASLNAYASCVAGGSAASTFNIVRGSTQVAEQLTSISNGSAVSSVANTITLVYLDNPNTTSSTTYKIQMKTTSGDTAILSLSSLTSTLTLLEIGA